MGDGQTVINPFLVHPHLKHPVVTLFISENGTYVVVTMKYGSLILDILEAPVHKCVNICGVAVKVLVIGIQPLHFSSVASSINVTPSMLSSSSNMFRLDTQYFSVSRGQSIYQCYPVSQSCLQLK